LRSNRCRLTPAQLREWGGDECVSAGKQVGIDYMPALNRAIAKDPAGLATLFRFTNTPQHDAAQRICHDTLPWLISLSLDR
jgi:hypothetical protein